MGALKKQVDLGSPSKVIVCSPEELHERVLAAVREAMGDRDRTEPLPEYLTTQQVADMLQCSTRNVRYLVVRNELRATRLSEREYRFKRADVLAYLEQRSTMEDVDP